ncbi:MAG: M16 family metallopeptidase [Candidatus Acidiferrales bacterium]
MMASPLIFRRSLRWPTAALTTLFLAGAITVAAQQAPAPVAPPAQTSAANPQPPTPQASGASLVGQMPPLAPPRPFHFPSVAAKTLPNGLRVFVVSETASSTAQPAVTIELLLPQAGSAADPHGKPGTASMVASLLTEGTERRTAQEINGAIDFVGGSLSASAGSDGTSVSATVVKRDFDLAMDLLSDITLHPSFTSAEIERRRQEALSDLALDYDDTEYLASAIFRRVVYGSGVYGLPPDGTPQSVRALTRDDLVEFHHNTYGPQGALLAIAGDLTPEEGFAAAEKYLGAWRPGGSSPVVTLGEPRPKGPRIFLIEKPDAVQTQIRVGRTGIPRNNPDYIPLSVTNQIFGGSYNARLNTAVRLKKGLTYDASSEFVSYRGAGNLLVSTFTRTEQSVAATQLVLDEIRKMSSGDVTQDEMDVARDFLAYVFPLHAETSGDVADRVLGVAFYGLPADYLDTYQDRVRAVTSADVKRIAQTYFDSSDLDLVLVGNVAPFRDALVKLLPGAKVIEIPAERLDLLSQDLQRPASSPAPGRGAAGGQPQSAAPTGQGTQP